MLRLVSNAFQLLFTSQTVWIVGAIASLPTIRLIHVNRFADQLGLLPKLSESKESKKLLVPPSIRVAV
jgi:hypothetical protein